MVLICVWRIYLSCEWAASMPKSIYCYFEIVGTIVTGSNDSSFDIFVQKANVTLQKSSPTFSILMTFFTLLTFLVFTLLWQNRFFQFNDSTCGLWHSQMMPWLQQVTQSLWLDRVPTVALRPPRKYVKSWDLVFWPCAMPQCQRCSKLEGRMVRRTSSFNVRVKIGRWASAPTPRLSWHD